MKKCPVCDWEIKDGGVVVVVGGQRVTVCCEECAEKAKKGEKGGENWKDAHPMVASRMPSPVRSRVPLLFRPS